MARARNIKPSFFQNDVLGELPPLDRLAFIGMWTIADFKGCLEHRPKRLKAQLLPYDDCDFEVIANNLDKSGFVRIYSVQGQRYIKIINFVKHQNPHKNEKEAGSEIPDLDENDNTINAVGGLAINRDKNGTAPADSPFLNPSSLIPDSPSLNPDSLNPSNPKKPKADAPRGSRLPADWMLPKSWGEWAAKNRKDLSVLDIREIGASFKDHWIAQPGRQGVKADWEATWRNWIRKERVKPVISFADRKAKEKADAEAAVDAWANGVPVGSTYIEGEFGRA
ncbi:hypothetical protein SAMN05216428_102344 [Nitrosospira sp. Nsp11]|uniref:hypothetical protein n=1 Tax=Nitrosospira sp. Nsp11 TaxID=1855338 RepID=UPI0009225A8D|nr:hypothetical protein [Nitrosospira sp. Nsp11]SHL41909.1 hypothetical protein SAMN05216428_102344 [Nitrosospira sp. Nsp11]